MIFLDTSLTGDDFRTTKRTNREIFSGRDSGVGVTHGARVGSGDRSGGVRNLGDFKPPIARS